MIDFSLPDDLIALRDRVAAFINDAIVPLERDPRQGPHGPAEELRREMVQLAREAETALAAWAGANGAGSASTIAAWRWSSKPPDGLRWDRSRSTSRRPMRATPTCSTGRDAGAKGTMARTAGARRNPHRLLDDRTRRRRRLRSDADENHRARRRRRLHHQRPQMVNHRRARRERSTS